MRHNGLIIESLNVSIHGQKILRGVSVDVEPGSITTLLGPSGCGKSTLLKTIVGLLEIDHGSINLNSNSLISVPVHKRGIGLMFQSQALFPHKNVEQNVAFGLQMQGEKAEQYRDKVSELLDIVGLSGFNKRNVGTLSGGEGQRVALARALAPKPNVLLLDEPFNSLDRSLRTKLLEEVRNILKMLDIAAIHVTHDWNEATYMADSMAFMNEGQIIRTGTIEEILANPQYSIVADLIGMETIWFPEFFEENGIAFFETPWGRKEANLANQNSIAALIRPENVHISRDGIQAEVLTKISTVGEWILKCRVTPDFTVAVKTTNNYLTGDRVSLQLDLESIEMLEIH